MEPHAAKHDDSVNALRQFVDPSPAISRGEYPKPEKRYDPARDILRLSAPRSRAQQVLTYLTDLQIHEGVNFDGLAWIAGMRFEDHRNALERGTGRGWSDSTFRRAIAFLKARGSIVVRLNKQHRGTAYVRVIPKAGRSRVEQAYTRRNQERAIAIARAAAADPIAPIAAAEPIAPTDFRRSFLNVPVCSSNSVTTELYPSIPADSSNRGDDAERSAAPLEERSEAPPAPRDGLEKPTSTPQTPAEIAADRIRAGFVDAARAADERRALFVADRERKNAERIARLRDRDASVSWLFSRIEKES